MSHTIETPRLMLRVPEASDAQPLLEIHEHPECIRHSRWGNGFATEAARAALDWAWANEAADHIISLIQPENASSIRIAEKIGERLERRDVINAEEVCIYGIRRP